MRNHSILTISMLLAAGLASSTALAGGDSGIYLGAGIARASVGDLDLGSGATYNFDGDDEGYKIIAGYNVDLVPLLDVAYDVGARVQLLSLQLRAEYERFDVSGDDDVDLLSLSALYTF